MKEILNQHNDLTNLPRGGLTAREIDVMRAVFYKCQQKGTQEIILSFDDIRELTGIRAKDDKELRDTIRKMNKKLQQQTLEYVTESGVEVMLAIFIKFETDLRRKSLTVKVSEEFKYLLNSFEGGRYTSLELEESRSLKKAYSKYIYGKLREYRGTGIWRVSIESFRRDLGVPEKYTTKEIKRSVLNPALEELKKYFDNLSCEITYAKKIPGRGRPAVTGFVFSYSPHEKKENNRRKELTQEEIARRDPNVKRVGLFCPQCGREVFARTVNTKYGQGVMYCHTDFQDGPCQWSSFNREEAVKEHEAKEKELQKEWESLSAQERAKREEVRDECIKKCMETFSINKVGTTM